MNAAWTVKAIKKYRLTVEPVFSDGVGKELQFFWLAFRKEHPSDSATDPCMERAVHEAVKMCKKRRQLARTCGKETLSNRPAGQKET